MTVTHESSQLSGKVLIVDTDLDTVHELGATFRSHGCEPLEATSFESAKQIWLAERPGLLVADVRLGQFNGLQLLVRARAHRPDLAAVITSPVQDGVLATEAERFGAAFLVKPVTPHQVLEALRPRRQTSVVSERRRGQRRVTTASITPERRHTERRKTPSTP